MINVYKKIVLFGLLSILISCANQEKKSNTSTAENNGELATKRISVIEIVSPKAGELFTIGDKINLEVKLKTSEVTVDSIVFEQGQFKARIDLINSKYSWDTKNANCGSNQLKLHAFSGGQRIDSYSLKLRFKSDIVPEKYTCKILKTYPHDRKSYTQGLIYENGIMYEGTGQYGESVLKKLDFKTGKLIAELSIPAQYFGEGITAFGDKIIQLTWKSRIGFVYDKKTFKLLNTLEYSTQGWGITTDNKSLIMSDGTQTIYFLDPEYFSEIGRIDVYDHNGPVDSLNELEYIDGLIYANIWQTEKIIAFDPKTGKVIKQIDCSSIVPEEFKNEQGNVLNGIAYDKDQNRIFITGKRWPELYQVEFVKNE